MVLGYFWSSQNSSHGQFPDVLYLVGVHYDIRHTYMLRKTSKTHLSLGMGNGIEELAANDENTFRIITFRPIRKQ